VDVAGQSSVRGSFGHLALIRLPGFGGGGLVRTKEMLASAMSLPVRLTPFTVKRLAPAASERS